MNTMLNSLDEMSVTDHTRNLPWRRHESTVLDVAAVARRATLTAQANSVQLIDPPPRAVKYMPTVADLEPMLKLASKEGMSMLPLIERMKRAGPERTHPVDDAVYYRQIRRRQAEQAAARETARDRAVMDAHQKNKQSELSTFSEKGSVDVSTTF